MAIPTVLYQSESLVLSNQVQSTGYITNNTIKSVNCSTRLNHIRNDDSRHELKVPAIIQMTDKNYTSTNGKRMWRECPYKEYMLQIDREWDGQTVKGKFPYPGIIREEENMLVFLASFEVVPSWW